MEITVNKPLAAVRAAFSSWKIRALQNMRLPLERAPVWTWSSSGRHPGKICPTTMSG